MLCSKVPEYDRFRTGCGVTLQESRVESDRLLFQTGISGITKTLSGPYVDDHRPVVVSSLPIRFGDVADAPQHRGSGD